MLGKIRSYSFEEYCEKVTKFHGSFAPGMLVGGFMIDLACRSLPPGTLFDVICETTSCLPDAVLLLTPCTVGNRWMKIIDVGRFALTLYDKDTGDGIRVYVDPGKTERWPAIKEWLLNLRPKEEQDIQELLDEIKQAGTGICGTERIRVSPDFLRKHKGKSISICPVCKEAYRSDDGTVCPACKDHLLPYVSEA